jgi:hypothetical protein
MTPLQSQLKDKKLIQLCDTIINNYINGNISDTQKAIRKLNKLQFAKFIEYFIDCYDSTEKINTFLAFVIRTLS